MGKKDVTWSDYLKDNRRYADIINGIACDGRQMVSQEDLEELDSKSSRSFGTKCAEWPLGLILLS